MNETRVRTKQFWSVKWIGNPYERLGIPSHIIYENLLPVLFKTRSEAREFVKAKYGFIAEREDLRNPPFNWRMPQIIKVEVVEVQ